MGTSDGMKNAAGPVKQMYGLKKLFRNNRSRGINFTIVVSVAVRMVAVIFICGLFLSAACIKRPWYRQPGRVSLIAFGSCARQERPQPVLDLVTELKPDLFIYLGDNVYNDSGKPGSLRRCYEMLGEKPEFIRLKKSVNILATWDDHDYGLNNSGKENHYKEDSKKIFLEFFSELIPLTSGHKGIYYSKIFDMGVHRIQVIMLDVRTFRDRPPKYKGEMKSDWRFNYRMYFSPQLKLGPTMLGEEQWAWLENQLRVKADLRIIGSGTQFAASYNGYESWANLPYEQQRMVNLIKSTGAGGVIFISGDVHYGEISRLDTGDTYPLYDVTSSGITSTWDFAIPNDNRIDGPVMENNFGLLIINWDKSDPEILMQIHDVTGEVRVNRMVSLSSLQFR